MRALGSATTPSRATALAVDGPKLTSEATYYQQSWQTILDGAWPYFRILRTLQSETGKCPPFPRFNDERFDDGDVRQRFPIVGLHIIVNDSACDPFRNDLHFDSGLIGATFNLTRIDFVQELAVDEQLVGDVLKVGSTEHTIVQIINETKGSNYSTLICLAVVLWCF